MDEAGVGAALLVQGVGAYSYDNAYTVDAAREHPRRFASVVCVDPLADGAAATLRGLVEERGARGVRLFTVTNPESSWLDESPGIALWEESRRLRIPVVVTILSRQIVKLANALRRFPDLRGGPPYERASALGDLAAFPNLHLKVTTHVLRLAEKDPAGPAPFVEHLAAIFGAHRLLWGSDFSQTHDRPYADMVALARRASAGLGASGQARFLGDTALELWPELRAR